MEEKDRYGEYKSSRDWIFPEDDWGLHVWAKSIKWKPVTDQLL